VPKYLPAVPVDAMVAGNKPIGYHSDGGIVYSVGMDGKDDGGSTTTLPRITPGPWDTADRVVFLGRQPRPVPQKDDEPEEPATLAEEHPSTIPASQP
jgi:hypothetical protein